MKVVFLSRYQNTVNRGAETFVFELSKRLSKNFRVDIFKDSDADNINDIIKGNYDIVIPMNGRMQSLKTSLGRIIDGYKLLITGQSGIGKDDIWNILLKPDVFVALTEYQKQWAKKWAWGSKVVKIPNGIDLEKFSPTGNKIELDLQGPIILSVGALTRYKYHDRVIKAVAKMSRGSLLIVGDGPEKNKLEGLGQRFLNKRFKIIKMSYKDIPAVYRSCDLFTLPSWDREAFGIVYLEALASGLGIVAPDDSTRREIVGDAGLFIDVTDSTKYKEAIEKALEIDWLKKARTQAQKFSWDKVADLYEKTLKDLFAV